MATKKIKIDSILYEQLERLAEVAGYASADEFAVHILETTASQIPDEADEELIRTQLQGLGYLE